MSRMSNLVIEIQEAIESGKRFEDIAKEFNVPLRWVEYSAEVMEQTSPDPGEMDGDAGSALASAGWGTDEDYGGYSEEF